MIVKLNNPLMGTETEEPQEAIAENQQLVLN